MDIDVTYLSYTKLCTLGLRFTSAREIIIDDVRVESTHTHMSLWLESDIICWTPNSMIFKNLVLGINSQEYLKVPKPLPSLESGFLLNL